MQTTYMPIKSLKLNDKNPRKINKEQFEKLCQNILNDPDFLEMRPVLVNETENGLIVYAGNQRVRAAKKIGLKKVPVIIVKDISEDLLRKRIILDNMSYGQHDYDMLSSLYEPMELLELGFQEKDLHIDLEHLEEENEIEEPIKCETCGHKIKKKKQN